MLKNIDYIYKQGSSEINEDAYVINNEEKIYGVIDGATGLGGMSGRIL